MGVSRTYYFKLVLPAREYRYPYQTRPLAELLRDYLSLIANRMGLEVGDVSIYHAGEEGDLVLYEVAVEIRYLGECRNAIELRDIDERMRGVVEEFSDIISALSNMEVLEFIKRKLKIKKRFKEEEYVKRLKKVLEDLKQGKYDEEIAHQLADEILCELLRELGFEEVVKAWEEIPKWYA